MKKGYESMRDRTEKLTVGWMRERKYYSVELRDRMKAISSVLKKSRLRWLVIGEKRKCGFSEEIDYMEVAGLGQEGGEKPD